MKPVNATESMWKYWRFDAKSVKSRTFSKFCKQMMIRTRRRYTKRMCQATEDYYKEFCHEE